MVTNSNFHILSTFTLEFQPPHLGHVHGRQALQHRPAEAGTTDSVRGVQVRRVQCDQCSRFRRGTQCVCTGVSSLDVARVGTQGS